MDYIIATLETLLIVFLSGTLAVLIGLPLGIILVITEEGNLKPLPLFNKVLGAIINLLRAFPFVILLLVLMPFTNLIVGTFIGLRGSIVPLTFAAFPFVARVIEGSIKEVDKGVIEAAESMGFNTFQIITKVLIPESLPGLIKGITLCLIAILGYSPMVSLVAGGGLGSMAVLYGVYRRNYQMMIISIILLMVIVIAIQFSGNMLVKKINKK